MDERGGERGERFGALSDDEVGNIGGKENGRVGASKKDFLR